MKDYIVKDPWNIIEEGFHPEYNDISESLFSLGNGKMGLRGNFAEGYSGKSLQGTYNAGIYYPDKTKVGWWKIGYPEYFAKVLNSCNWIGIDIWIDNLPLDLAKCTILNFRRTLDMREGILYRSCRVDIGSGRILNIKAERFTSMADDEIGVLKWEMQTENFEGDLKVVSYLDFDVMNQDANYEEKFWKGVAANAVGDTCMLQAKTLKTGFELGVGLKTSLSLNKEALHSESPQTREKFAGTEYTFRMRAGDNITLIKFAGFASSLYYDTNLARQALQIAGNAYDIGFKELKERHINAWAQIWENCDIAIGGDVSAQQGIRFNIFHLMQTYTGKDARLNIGPKGFTGEKYGGSTYWDTEAYCLPFYQSTADKKVALQLLKYRYKHLAKAIDNAQKLGFIGGAALYPMVTMNGEECHNEWEITFEEIHRNGAIAYAIFDYIRYNNDDSYLSEGGLEVLIGIARFWAQRFNWSEQKQAYVMLGVTGPNEYENNVNNNWYTNYIARWCLNYARQSMDVVRTKYPTAWVSIRETTGLTDAEAGNWTSIADNVYFPYDGQREIFLQQDGFLDKELLTTDDLSAADRPINQNWSWDRILRSVFIKQADVLQGLYFFEENFTEAEIRRHFEFYEPRTVHESSLSPCVHCILACRLAMDAKAYEMYLRTSRLDLDDYNNDTEDGLHITSMAGTWMSIVKGFGGMRIIDNNLHFTPRLPSRWDSCSFKILFRGNLLKININRDGTTVDKFGGDLDKIFINGNEIIL